jgi:Mn-dependent DtxR family transcriptional regulator
MSETIAIRVSDRTMAALRRGESARVRLDRSTVVGGVTRRAGRKPGRNSMRSSLWCHRGRLPRAGSVPARLLLWAIEHGGGVDSRQAQSAIRRGRVHASGVLSLLAHAGLLRREHWGRYSVTAKGTAARAALSDIGLYRKGTHRRRLAEWAIGRQEPFDVVDAARLLGISHGSVHTVLTRLRRDRVIERESLGVYRAK